MEGFDIFSGRLEYEPMWLETAQSLDEAMNRMKDRAQKAPGPYFVYSCETRKVIESIDTSNSTTSDSATSNSLIDRAPHAA